MKKQRGFISAPSVLLVLLFIGGVFYYHNKNNAGEVEHRDNMFEAIETTENIADDTESELNNLTKDNKVKSEKEDEKIVVNPDTVIELKVGNEIGEFMISEIKECTYLFTGACGVKTVGIADLEGYFYSNTHMGGSCFELYFSNELNSESLTYPLKRDINKKYSFCFTKNSEEKIPEEYLPGVDEVSDEMVRIRVKDFDFDWRPLGTTDRAVFVEIVD